MAAMSGAIGFPHDDMRMQLRVSLVVARDIAHERQQFDLFLDRDRRVFSCCRLKEAQCHTLKGANSCEMLRCELLISREPQQGRYDFFPDVEHHGERLLRAVAQQGGLHGHAPFIERTLERAGPNQCGTCDDWLRTPPPVPWTVIRAFRARQLRRW